MIIDNMNVKFEMYNVTVEKRQLLGNQETEEGAASSVLLSSPDFQLSSLPND